VRKISLLLILAFAFSSVGQSPDNLDRIKREITISTGRIDELRNNLEALRSSIDRLDLQQRTTRLEENSKDQKADIEKINSTIDKYQWALIGLLAEAVWRIYDKSRSRSKEVGE